MKPISRLAVLSLALALAIAPSLAHARAGSGSNSGSKGSRTYQSTPAQPIQKSVTPTPSTQPGQSTAAARPGAAAQPAAAPGFFARNPFLTGLAGGLLGAGIGSMLFGGGAMAGGSGLGSMIGTMLQIALIGGLILLVVMWFRRRNQATAEPQAAGAAAYSNTASSYSPVQDVRPVTGLAGPAGGMVHTSEIGVGETDQETFGRMLTDIQTAWTNGDISELRRNLTPEMLSYFSEELAANVSRGVENRVESVALQEGDVKEAWTEEGRDYATCFLRWTALDYTVRTDKKPGEAGWLVSGDNKTPSEAQEVWTFVRQREGRWLLSAVQQI